MLRQIMMSGSIHYTNDVNIILQILNDPTSNTIVVDIDEDSDPRISKQHPRVIGGSCLLPPMEGLIAAADGEHEVFRMIYAEHFASPAIDNYISALLVFMILKGGHLILYYDDELGVIQDFISIFWMRYGIQIGVIGESNYQYDPSCMPIWLQYLYRENHISGDEFLFNYPLDTEINPVMIEKLLAELLPYGTTIQDRIKELYRLSSIYKQNPNAISPLMWVGS